MTGNHAVTSGEVFLAADFVDTAFVDTTSDRANHLEDIIATVQPSLSPSARRGLAYLEAINEQMRQAIES